MDQNFSFFKKKVIFFLKLFVCPKFFVLLQPETIRNLVKYIA